MFWSGGGNFCRIYFLQISPNLNSKLSSFLTKCVFEKSNYYLWFSGCSRHSSPPVFYARYLLFTYTIISQKSAIHPDFHRFGHHNI
jgi:hypothetical protein